MKIVKVIFMFGMSFVLLFSNSSCENGQPNSLLLFFGEWANFNTRTIITITISEEEMVYAYPEYGKYYKVSLSKWKAIKNKNNNIKELFPKGYEINGVVTENTLPEIFPYRVGHPFARQLFLNMEKNELMLQEYYNKAFYTELFILEIDSTEYILEEKNTLHQNVDRNSSTVSTSSSARSAPATDFNYRLSRDNNGVVITGYTGYGGNLIIPTEIEGFPVVELGNDAFMGESTITSVVIPASVKKIGSRCFLGYMDFSRLVSVTFLGSGVEIGWNAFNSCTNLTELKFPDGDKVLFPVNNQDFMAFSGCTKLPLAVRAKLMEWGFWEP